MRIRLTLLSCVAVLLAGAGGPAAAEWKKHTYTADGFEVEFSGQISVEETEMTPATREKIVRSTNYMQGSDDFTYIVGASLMRYDVNFDNGIKSSFTVLKCKVTTKDAPFTVAGARGREVIGTDCLDGTFSAETRYLTRDKWFYQTMTIFKKAGGDAESARYFLRSFKLIGK
jgi:hypothetical protein